MGVLEVTPELEKANAFAQMLMQETKRVLNLKGWVVVMPLNWDIVYNNSFRAYTLKIGLPLKGGHLIATVQVIDKEVYDNPSLDFIRQTAENLAAQMMLQTEKWGEKNL